MLALSTNIENLSKFAEPCPTDTCIALGADVCTIAAGVGLTSYAIGNIIVALVTELATVGVIDTTPCCISNPLL